MSDSQETDKLLAIKDIIFGDQIKEYNSEFETLKAQMDAQKSAFEAQIKSFKDEFNESKREFSSELAKLQKELNKEITSLKDAKMERKKLSKLFADISTKIAD